MDAQEGAAVSVSYPAVRDISPLSNQKATSLCSPCMLRIFYSSGKLSLYFIQLCSQFDSEYDWHS